MPYELFPINDDLPGLLTTLWRSGARGAYVFPDYYEPGVKGSNAHTGSCKGYVRKSR